MILQISYCCNAIQTHGWPRQKQTRYAHLVGTLLLLCGCYNTCLHDSRLAADAANVGDACTSEHRLSAALKSISFERSFHLLSVVCFL